MTNCTRVLAWFSCCVLLTVSVVGCSQGGADLGQVEGTVTLDGQPLANAVVEFQPEAEGRPSMGSTDSSGHYELMYTRDTPGAMIGKHRVRIELSDSDDEPGAEPALAVPEKYNAETELSEEVAAGSQTIDFTLTSE
jgi:hypothetical protein